MVDKKFLQFLSALYLIFIVSGFYQKPATEKTSTPNC